MQIKDRSRVAYSFSAEEFEAIMRDLMEIAPKIMERAMHGVQVLIEKNQPVYSFDNWTGHMDACEKLGLDEKSGTRAPLAARSPDMHKAIEHIFNTVQAEFGKRLWLHPGKHSMETYIAVLEDILYHHVTLESIRRDIDSLPSTYKNIIARGGNWAEDPYR